MVLTRAGPRRGERRSDGRPFSRRALDLKQPAEGLDSLPKVAETHAPGRDECRGRPSVCEQRLVENRDDAPFVSIRMPAKRLGVWGVWQGPQSDPV